jgi:hypothetical protein
VRRRPSSLCARPSRTSRPRPTTLECVSPGRALTRCCARPADLSPRSSPPALRQTPADYELALISRATTPSQVTLPNIPDGVRTEDFQELEILYQDMRRILRSAAANGVRILIDSEHSWFQVRPGQS